jgi:hypothetical protein
MKGEGLNFNNVAIGTAVHATAIDSMMIVKERGRQLVPKQRRSLFSW